MAYSLALLPTPPSNPGPSPLNAYTESISPSAKIPRTAAKEPLQTKANLVYPAKRKQQKRKEGRPQQSSKCPGSSNLIELVLPFDFRDPVRPLCAVPEVHLNFFPLSNYLCHISPLVSLSLTRARKPNFYYLAAQTGTGLG